MVPVRMAFKMKTASLRFRSNVSFFFSCVPHALRIFAWDNCLKPKYGLTLQ